MFKKLIRGFQIAWSWVCVHTRRPFLKLLGTVLRSWPYDADDLYEIEKAKLEEILNQFERMKEKNTYTCSTDEDIRDLRLCISLLDKIVNESKLYDYLGDLKLVKDPENKGCYKFHKSENWKYICKVNVNFNNISRFSSPIYFDFYRSTPHELYLRKAKYLYHKIRYERDDGWWD